MALVEIGECVNEAGTCPRGAYFSASDALGNIALIANRALGSGS